MENSSPYMRIVEVPTAFPKYVLMRLQQFICQYKCFEKRPPKNLKFLAVSGTKFKFKIFHEKLETHIMNAEQRFLLVLQDKTCKKIQNLSFVWIFHCLQFAGGHFKRKAPVQASDTTLKTFHIFPCWFTRLQQTLEQVRGHKAKCHDSQCDKICTYILRM